MASIFILISTSQESKSSKIFIILWNSEGHQQVAEKENNSFSLSRVSATITLQIANSQETVLL